MEEDASDHLGEITQDLHRMTGDAEAEERVFTALKRELHSLARFFLARNTQGHTLQATALVNEVYLRLHRLAHIDWQNRKHFLDVAAKAMRSILIDHARGKKRLKRMPPGERVTLENVAGNGRRDPLDPLMLEEALVLLGNDDPMAARIVQYRFFLGLAMEEIARVLETSLTTVERKWRLARAFIHGQLS